MSYHTIPERVRGMKPSLVKDIAFEREALPAEDMSAGCGSRILPGTETESALALATGCLTNDTQNISTTQ